MSSDLFNQNPQNTPLGKWVPLSERARPSVLEDFFGQDRLLQKSTLLRQWISQQSLPSLLLSGPPGSGKTTLARILAKAIDTKLLSLSAVEAGTKELREAIREAELFLSLWKKKPILLIDEIHRFNRTQQDALLPHVEEGKFTLIGATTENPMFCVQPALRSRLFILELEILSVGDLTQILARALSNDALIKSKNIQISENALGLIAEESGGDARFALNTLETLVDGATKPALSEEDVKNFLKTQLQARRPVRYDRVGEEHYNTISAFIKSVRASRDQDSLFYLARMLHGGEDPVFIARRMVIFAAEDIGLADPKALSVAIATKEGVEFVGMPEARIILSFATLYLARAPKSKEAYIAIEKSLREVEKNSHQPIPKELRNV